MQTTTPPKQYSPKGTLIKRFLHTKLGAFIGFYAGISGFNSIEAVKAKLIREYKGEKLNRKEFIYEGKVYKPVTRSYAFNARTDKGAALTASLMTGTSLGSISSPLPPIYIALSTSVLTPAKSDTTLTSETVVSGLTRALGTIAAYTAPSVLDGGLSYTISNTFTMGAAGPVTINSTALFDASSSGNLYVEGNLSAGSILVNTDILIITWTVNH